MGANEGERVWGECALGEDTNLRDAAVRRAAEHEYARDLAREAQAQKVEDLRQTIAVKEAALLAVQASLEAVVAQIQRGTRLADESGRPTVQALNQTLAAEAQNQKLQLLSQQGVLTSEIQALKEQLATL